MGKKANKNITIIDYLEKKTFEKPQNIAYIFNNEKITYNNLLEKVNGFAGYLLEQGVKKGDIVGVCLNRSIEMVIGLLAIIKIKATYLPIDIKYPLKRISFMLNHARVKYLVTDDIYSAKLDISEVKKIYITNNNIKKCDIAQIVPEEENADYCAYVIYTSGSTGVPKGVQVGNTSLINVLQSTVEVLNLTMSDTILAVTTISFDIAALELFICLLVGAKCVIASDFEKMDGNLLNTIFERYHVSIMQATPTHFKLLIQTGWRGSKDVRLLCGGEPLDYMTAKILLERSKELWNMYGPTETTIWSTMTKISSPDLITISSPIANTVIYICTKDMQQVDCNQVGEMYIGGIGVSWGYLYDKELTRERYIQSPFPAYKGILFRTGDLVKKTQNNEIIFIGRQDSQVKHKGYRIELGEIDTHLSTISGIEYTTTILEEDSGYTLLNCLVKTEQNFELIEKKILEVAKSELPYYMRPDKISFLKTLPLTDNGKVDRNILKNAKILDKYLYKNRKVFIQNTDDLHKFNSNPHSRIVSKIVSQIHGGQVAEQDNLVDLGFDSLKMAEVVTSLRLNGYEVDFGIFEKCLTISDIAQYLEGCCRKEKDDTIVEYSIMPSDISDKIVLRKLNNPDTNLRIKALFPTTLCQHCMIQYSLMYKGSKAYNQVVVHKIYGTLNVEKCKEAFSNLVRKCDLFNSVYLAGYKTSYRATVDLIKPDALIEFIDILPTGIWKIIKESVDANYNLGNHLSFLLKIVHVNEHEYFFIWSYHHVLFDGYSIEKIIEIFWELYRGACFNEKISVSINNTNQYIYWVKRQVISLEAKQFWKESTNLLMLTETNKIENKKRPTLESIDTQGELLWTVKEELTSDFMKRLKSIHVLPHAGIKAVWAIVWHKVLKKQIVSFGNVLSGRSSCLPEHRELIGVMINIVPVCFDFRKSMTFHDFLQETQKEHVMQMKYEYFPLDAIGWPVKKIYDAMDCIIVYNHPSTLISNVNNRILSPLNLRINNEKTYDIINCELSLSFSYDRQLQIQASYNRKFYTEQDVKSMMHSFEKTLRDINDEINALI